MSAIIEVVNIEPNQPFNPFASFPDDTSPDEVLAIALQEQAEACDSVEYLDCKVFFPARVESRILPIRLTPGDSEPESRIPEKVVIRGDSARYVLVSLNGGWSGPYVCLGRSATIE